MQNKIVIDYKLVACAEAFSTLLTARSDQFLLKSHEIGADREQWFIESGNDLIVICVEHLSESAWIEAMGKVPLTRLQSFYKHLFCH
jgi:hypothetical protein